MYILSLLQMILSIVPEKKADSYYVHLFDVRVLVYSSTQLTSFFLRLNLPLRNLHHSFLALLGGG